MVDFVQIITQEKKGGVLEAFPDFVVARTEDLMVRAKGFYAIWDEDLGLWSTDEYDVQRIVDDKLKAFADKNPHIGKVKYMRSFANGGQTTFRRYMSQIGDNSHPLDESLTFKSTDVKKKDYVSKRLPYDIGKGDISAWDQMVGTLYKPEEREKIEWFIGSIVSGDSKKNQKFMVLYGPPGAGKGTIIDIVLMLFDGYTTSFDAKALGSSGNQFASAAFEDNPLVAIQHDGDLSRIEDNTILNMVVSHELMKINQKNKPAFDAKLIAALIMGTNKPVKITDAQSGLIRRLIDVHPSGIRLPANEYHRLKNQIAFELGAIAHHCLSVYQELGKNHYSNYRPMEMMYKTNAFFNFIETYYDLFEKQNGVSSKQAWNLYKEYCEEANIDKTSMKLYAFKDELGKYFEKFHERIILDGTPVRSYYEGFIAEPFKVPVDNDTNKFVLKMDETTSLLNLELAEYPAQYAKADGTPSKYWDDSERLINGTLQRPRLSQIVDTLLQDINPYEEHYVKVPENMIVIDFDLRDESGGKSLARNLEAASQWPPTYGELSKSGEGVHLHYYWTGGDVAELDQDYADGIEVKVFTGNSSLRRRLSRCNDVAVADLSSGLPIKEKKRVLDPQTMKSEKGLRELIARNLRKEIHPGTKPSIDFIKKILDEAYESEMQYDVSDMYQKLVAFANNSTNRALECLKLVSTMKLKSSDKELEDAPPPPAPKDDRLVILDLEVYPNLFVICWKYKEEKGVEPNPDNVVRMINPKPHEVEALLNLNLVGFNVRQYDNHVLWAAALGFNNDQLFRQSQKIIDGVAGAKFGKAYNISYVDIYDFSTKKQSLKKWQVELHLKHQEMDLPWDQPVPEDRWQDVVDYCVNDVLSTEKVLDHLEGDFKARLILADLSGLPVNETTARHTAAIVFGKEKNPQKEFKYTDLSKEFPGYVFESGKSTYRGEEVGEGGLVRAKPGLYRDVALLDIASMHPTSIGQLNLFGDYTPRYMAIVEAQLALKRGDYANLKGMLDGKFGPYVEEIEALQATNSEAAAKAAKDLRYGLKIAMNIVYGLTSAKFDNPFKDFRNVDNIVAKRGALFMVDLMKYAEEQGINIVHVKTDSVKIANATDEQIEKVMLFGEKYGYSFENEADYSNFALFNDAVYIAKKDECVSNCWTATGTQFIPEANPYVFKKLFGYSDDIHFYDLCITKSVQQGAIYLDFGSHDEDNNFGFIEQSVAWVKLAEKKLKDAEKIKDPSPMPANTVSVRQDLIDDAKKTLVDAQLSYELALKKLIHVGRTGQFTPVLPGYGGGQLWRIKDGKHYAISGTKGYLWVESSIAMDLPSDAIDYGYFEKLVEEAKNDINFLVENHNYGEFAGVEEFLS